MKRYLLFVMDNYYPNGGWSDFADSFDTIQEANDYFTSLHRDDYDLVDTTTWERVYFN